MDDNPVDINAALNHLASRCAQLQRELAIAHGTIEALKAQVRAKTAEPEES